MGKITCLTLMYLFFSGCVGIPANVTAVKGFNAKEYLGTWYEIARLDHSFEKGLSNVTATYTMREDGELSVLNRGFDKKAGRWKEVKGKAFFINGPNEGRLKVSFFGPFYGSYNIIALDKEKYTHALVCGSDRSYLWILARDKKLKDATLRRLVGFASRLGFETDKLILVDQSEV